MSYADITFKDRNPIKRWLQRRRLLIAVELAEAARAPSVICDFGAGNGEILKILSAKYPSARLICYEPAADLMAEARANLGAIPNVEFVEDVASVAAGSVDIVFCLEVFEHLPPRETNEAMQQINTLLGPGGTAVIGVPVEVHLPALYRGVFRMTRRRGAFDANAAHVLRSMLGRPPRERPLVEIKPGFRFYPFHNGFDYRDLRETLAARFDLRKSSGSPFMKLGGPVNSEVYFVVGRANDSAENLSGRS